MVASRAVSTCKAGTQIDIHDEPSEQKVASRSVHCKLLRIQLLPDLPQGRDEKCVVRMTGDRQIMKQFKIMNKIIAFSMAQSLLAGCVTQQPSVRRDIPTPSVKSPSSESLQQAAPSAGGKDAACCIANCVTRNKGIRFDISQDAGCY
jgi:hypothetical protein